MQIDGKKSKKTQKKAERLNIFTETLHLKILSSLPCYSQNSCYSILLTFEIEIILDYNSLIYFGQDIGKLNNSLIITAGAVICISLSH